VRESAPSAPPQRDGLSLQTLVIAAVASGAAALIVSHLWQRGTILASAMTPVFVALVSEALRKPAQSDLVRKPLRVARTAVTSPNPVTFERTPDPAQTTSDGASAPDVRIYSSGSDKAHTSPRRKLHIKVAVVTGLVAFLIAALALTLPELIFGGSVAGKGRSTTYFGGSSTKSSSSGSKTQDQNQTDTGKSSGDQTQQTQTDQTGQTDTTPQGQTPDQTTPGQTQTTPQNTAPTAPPATPPQTTPTTPAPTP
jgi:hypothetical protein